MSSHIRGNQYCANRSMSREPKHLETCRKSFHVRGNQYCSNRSMSRERKRLETCQSTTKQDCSPSSMLAKINARGKNQQQVTESRSAPRSDCCRATERARADRGYYRSRPNNDTRHAPCLRGAWRLGVGAGIFLSLLSRHRDHVFVLAIALAPLTAQVSASGHMCSSRYAYTMLAGVV